jgi:hypothetical protein
VRKLNVDLAGAVASGLCVIHCLATGVLFAATSFVSSLESVHSVWEYFFIALATVLGGFAAVVGHKKHRSWVPLAIFGSGLTALLTKQLVLEPRFGHHWLVSACAIVAGVLLIVFHWVNQKFTQRKFTQHS